MSNNESIVEKDFNARRRIAGYLSLFALLAMSTVTVIPLFFIYKFDAEAVTNAITPALLATVLAELLVIVALLKFTGDLRNWRDFLGLKNFKLKHIAIGVAVGFASMVTLQLLSIAAAALGTATENSDTSDAIGGLTGTEKLLVLFVLVPVVVPFVEELFFRGFTLMAILRGHQADPKNLKARGTVLAILFSSLFFAIAHFQGFETVTDFMVVGWTFTFAIFNSILRLKCDSLYPAYASHLTYNLVTALAISIA